MKVTGTLINYYFHCKRQCYLFGHRINFEDNSENVRIGRAIHEEHFFQNEQAEISIENVRMDKISREYLTELKKSDADPDAAKWQILLYLKILKNKGLSRKGRVEFVERNKGGKRTVEIELTAELERELDTHILSIEQLLEQETIPNRLSDSTCKKCAYYEYCYI